MACKCRNQSQESAAKKKIETNKTIEKYVRENAASFDFDFDTDSIAMRP